jgi:hypothetical protein
MKRLTRDKFLHCAGLSANRFDVMAHAGHVALAFSVPVPAVAGQYLDLDTIAMRITNELTPVVGRDDATLIVLTYFDVWCDAVGRADFDSRQMFFGVGIIDASKERDREYLITSGVPEEIVADFADFKQDRVIVINVTRLIEQVREAGQSAGIDLNEPFFLPPDHPDYRQLIAEGEQLRLAALARLRQDKRRFARHKRRSERMIGRDLSRPRTAMPNNQGKGLLKPRE